MIHTYIHTYIHNNIVGFDCKCKDFVNDNGHGNCLTDSISEKHDGQRMCYVIQPSGCNDLVESTHNLGELYSEEACEKTGLIYHMILEFVKESNVN